MKKHIPVILLSMLCVALLVALQLQRQETARLTKIMADTQAAPGEPSEQVQSRPDTDQQTVLARNSEKEKAQPPEDGPATETETEKETARRIMRDMAKMIDDNPTINKMVEASQRGAIGALYADMIEYLKLDTEETGYFMDLLMARQMAHVDMHMKMASGNLTEEERLALQEKARMANEATRSEMEKFLNDSEDFDEFRFYEETIGERMMLSQMDQTLGDAALSDETYREVLEIMYDERESYDWSTDLHDSESTDMNPERFSEDNIARHMADIKAVGERMDQRMQTILTPEQLDAWRESGLAMQALVSGQLIQANQAFGSE